MEVWSVGVRVTVESKMEVRRSLWGVGCSRTEGDCGMVVTKDTQPSLQVLAVTLGVPAGASVGTF